MMRSCWIAALLVLLSLSAPAQKAEVTFGTAHLTSEQYLGDLDHFQKYVESLDTAHPAESPYIPDEWIIDAQGREYHVSTNFLRNLKERDDREEALAQIKALKEGVTGALQPAGKKSARNTADTILKRREFRGVRTPGKKESWIDRATQWLIHAIEKFFGKAIENAAAIRTFVTVLTWALLLAAASLVFFWLFRTLRALSTPEMRLEGRPAEYVSSKPAETWLAEARAAAAKGEFRLAIGLAYWAGIAGLERAGAWRPDRARTPREYLRQAGDAAFLPTLRSLTRDFERVWYANQPATPADFDSALLRVKELGWQ